MDQDVGAKACSVEPSGYLYAFLVIEKLCVSSPAADQNVSKGIGDLEDVEFSSGHLDQHPVWWDSHRDVWFACTEQNDLWGAGVVAQTLLQMMSSDRSNLRTIGSKR